MQCDDCGELYRADNTKQPCPNCGGKGTVLADVTGQFFGNRQERRKAGYYGKRKLEKYLPCPKCTKQTGP